MTTLAIVLLTLYIFTIAASLYDMNRYIKQTAGSGIFITLLTYALCLIPLINIYTIYANRMDRIRWATENKYTRKKD